MNKKLVLFAGTTAAILLMAAILFPRAIRPTDTTSPALVNWTTQKLDQLAARGAAEQAVQASWQLAKLSGAYDFHSEIEQTTYFAPALTNVGRPAEVERIVMEGQTNLPDRSLQLALWQGGSVTKPVEAMEMRVDGEAAYGRAAGGSWRKVEDFSSGFAPGRDLLAYLHGARDIRELTPASGGNYRKFSFRVDGPAFADYMRLQLEDELRRKGKLPASLNLDTPRIYRDIAGEGEIWLASNGLPLRMEIAIAFPQESDGSRVKATIRTDFSNYSALDNKAALIPAARLDWPGALGLRLQLVDWPAAAGQVGLALLAVALVAFMLVFSRRPRVYAAFALAVIVAMVVGPLAESAKVYAFNQEQAASMQATQAMQASQQAQRELEATLRGPAWDPTVDPLGSGVASGDGAPATAAGANTAPQPQPSAGDLPALGTGSLPAGALTTSLLAAAPADECTDCDKDGVPDAEEPAICLNTTDCDNDGLTNLQEYRLGTSLNNPDSDGDGLRDDMEVKGFGSGSGLGASGKWYANPLNIDTNRDGLPDSLECWSDDTLALINGNLPSNRPCDRDSDGNGTPDMFEADNDKDGVDDSVDLSPYIKSDAVYNHTHPFSFNIQGLTAGEPLFVDFQLVPTSTKQLSYAGNVLNWPENDSIGQLQRNGQATTFASVSLGETPASSSNGDLRMTPLVEIKIPAAAAGDVLPVTQSLTTTRRVTGYVEVTTGSGAAAVTELQPWLKAEVEFRAAIDPNTTQPQVEITFTSITGTQVTLSRAKIFAFSNSKQASCPVAETAQPQYETPTNGAPWLLPAGVGLPSILDGKHVIVLEKDNAGGMLTACLQPGDIPNGSLPAGEMFDTAALDAYGITLRDDTDASGKVTGVMAYLPANVETGRTGGEKQAFAVRMPYTMRNGKTSLGAAQEVRLIWMVQMLGDDGNTQIVHSYPNEGWVLAGLSARQDLEVRSAVIYQNPDGPYNTDPDLKRVQTRTWAAAQVLGDRFASKPKGKDRLALDDNLQFKLETTFRFPSDSLTVTLTTYQSQDEVARIPTEVTPGELAHFVSNGAYKTGYTHALLLFAREEDYKSTSWSGGESFYSPITGSVLLSLPSESSTLASYNWKPFRYTGSAWEPYPVAEYLDLIKVHLDDALLATASLPPVNHPDRQAALDGMTMANQSFALGMFFGGNQLVQTGAYILERPEDDEDDPIEDVGDNSKGLLEKTAGDVVDHLFEDDVEKPPRLTRQGASRNLLAGVETPQLKRQAALGNLNKGWVEPELEGKLSKITGYANKGLKVARYGMAMASLGLSIATLAGSDQSDASDQVGAVAASLELISSVVDMVEAVQDAGKAVNAAGGWAKAISAPANAISRAAKIMAVVGLVISVGVAVGVFIAQWASGAFGITDLAFTAALAGVISAVAVAVIMFAIALIPVIGQLIAAVIAIVDGLIAAICAISKASGYDLEKASTYEIPRTNSKLSFCDGLSGLLAEGIKFVIFSQNVLFDMYDKNRLSTSNFQLGIVDAVQGFQVGNTLLPSVRVDNKIKLIDQPVDWKSALYAWQLNWDNLDDATLRYDLTPEDESERDVSLAQMETAWQELDKQTGKLTGGHRSPGIQYQDPLVMLPATASMAGGQPATFTEPGINVTIPLYLREAYANPAQECWYAFVAPPVCYIRSDKGTNHIDVSLQFDIFPATLDGFYAPAPKNTGSGSGGYSLAWGQNGDLTFPVMRDFDGDGLLSPASPFNGNDPNDSLWDTDGDGLGDAFELQHGTDPTDSDSDVDGLSDRQELNIGSNPTQRDTDGDGLSDGEEVLHAGATSWNGGWELVYDLKNGAPLSTWISSDPTASDRDKDTLTDYQERLYGLNPWVKSDPSIIKLESQLREANAPSALLRFEEHAGANLFSDISGLANNATCEGAACPSAGHEGQYTNGLIFDGSNDYLEVAETVPLTGASFTVAFWAKRYATGYDHIAFSSGNQTAYQGLTIGFRSNNTFTCSFNSAGLNTPATYTDNAWHHWACTFDAIADQRSIYRDGVLVAQDYIGPYQGAGAWRIGAAAWGGSTFDGTLDEMAVFSRALDPSQIQAEMAGRYNPGGAQVAVARNDVLSYTAGLENNLLGKSLTGLLSIQSQPGINTDQVAPATYKLSPAGQKTMKGLLSVASTAASGTYNLALTAGAAATDPRQASNYAQLYLPFDDNYNDFSGSQPPLTVSAGGPAPSPQFLPGMKGRSVNLGTGRYLVLPPSVTPTTETDFTFATWLYWRGATTTQQYLLNFVNGSRSLNFYPSISGLMRFSITDGTTTQQLTAAAPTANTWVHVAVTLQGDLGRLYVNGTPVDNDTITLNPADIGGRGRFMGNNFNGQLDEAYIYSKALTASEIADLGGPSVHFTFTNRSDPWAYNPGKRATTRYGAPSWTKNSGGGITLNGQSVLEVANDPAFNMRSTAFTYALWIKPSGRNSGGEGVRAVFGQPPPLAPTRDWTDTNGGVYLLVRDDPYATVLKFGWGDDQPLGSGWSTGWIPGLTRDSWNQVVITSDGAANPKITVYVNGVSKKVANTGTKLPPDKNNFSLGDNNYCGQFELRNVYTDDEQGSDSGPDAEYVYDFYDEYGNLITMLYDDNADSGDWEPGDGPPHHYFTDKKYIFCGTGARVHVYEHDGAPLNGNDEMGPDLKLNIATPPSYREYTTLIKNGTWDSPRSSQKFHYAGRVIAFYDVRNPSLPFHGTLDDFRIYRRALSAQEVDQLYTARELPYHFTFDDPPGAGLNAALFNFNNEGSIANSQAGGFCNPGACPTSGLPGRIGQAVQFSSPQSIQIKNFGMGFGTLVSPGISFWVNPGSTNFGQVMKLTTTYGSNLATVVRTNNDFCLIASTSVCTTGGNFPDNQWHHVLVQFIYFGFTGLSSPAALIVNGQQAPGLAYWNSSAKIFNLTLGGGFSGQLDDLRFPVEAAPSNTAATLMAQAPRALLHLEEAGANVTSFENVGSANATCSGTACPDAGVKGKVGLAAGFDGVDDGLSIGNSLYTPDNFSLSVWIKPSSLDQNMNILSGPAYALRLNQDRVTFTRSCGGSTTTNILPPQLPNNQWSHVAVTRDYGTLAFYVNGQPAGTTINSTTCTSRSALAIGSPTANSTGFFGSIDEVQVYARGLKDYEVKAIFDTQANWVEERQNYDIIVDAESPVSSLAVTLPAAVNYFPNADKQLGIAASDATTSVAMLELGLARNGGPMTWTAAEACQDASGGTAWCPWFKPTTLGGEGRYTLRTRATDLVGNRESPSINYVILVDTTGPNLTADQLDGGLQTLQTSTSQPNTQVLYLSGSADDPLLSSGDPGSGTSEVWVALRDPQGQVVGAGPYPADLTGSAWSIEYPFQQEQVSGRYTLEVTAHDGLGNQAAPLSRALLLDGTAPGIELDELASGLPITSTQATFITETVTLSGLVSELPRQPGALAAYHFEESAGAVSFANAAASSGGSAAAASCAGAACPTAGIPAILGNSLSFDGATDEVSIATDQALNGSFTVAAWVKLNPAVSTHAVLGSRAPVEFGFDLQITTGVTSTIHAAIGDGTQWLTGGNGGISAEANFNYTPDQWLHVACVVTPAGYAIYADGVRVGAGSFNVSGTPLLADASHLLRLGANGAGQRLNGGLDEVLLYRQALSDNDIGALAAGTVNGLALARVAFTPLWSDDGSAASSPHFSPIQPGQALYLPLNNAPDQHGNITFRNLADPASSASCTGITCPSPAERSPAGSALAFDGVDDALEVNLTQAIGGDFSIAAWIKPFTSTLGVLESRSPADFGFELSFTGGDTIHAAIGDGANWLATQADAAYNYTSDQWLHLAYVVTPAGYTIYINGVQQAAGSFSGTPLLADASHRLRLGADGDGRLLNGALSDVQVFRRALNGTEIQSLWRGTRAALSLPLDKRFMFGGNSLSDASGWNQVAILDSGAADPVNKASIVGASGPYALQLDGVDDSIRAEGVGATLAGAPALSYGGWINPNASDYHAIMGFDTPAGSLGSLLVLYQGNLCYLDAAGANICASPLYADPFSHVMVTIDAQNLGTLYMNGSAVLEFTSTWRPAAADIFKVGASADSAWSFNPFSGYVDGVRAYPRLLNAAEVADLANASWRYTAALTGVQSSWSLPFPSRTELEGIYRLDLQAFDLAGQGSFNRQEAALTQLIDTLPPRASLTRQDILSWGPGGGNRYVYTFTAADQFLTRSGLSTPCGPGSQVNETYRMEALSGLQILSGVQISCELSRPAVLETATVCDRAGHCSSVGVSAPLAPSAGPEAPQIVPQVGSASVPSSLSFEDTAPQVGSLALQPAAPVTNGAPAVFTTRALASSNVTNPNTTSFVSFTYGDSARPVAESYTSAELPARSSAVRQADSFQLVESDRSLWADLRAWLTSLFSPPAQGQEPGDNPTSPAWGSGLGDSNRPVSIQSFTSGMAANFVLGQPDFTSIISSTTQTGMFHPTGVAVDPTTGKVFVAESANHRVLRFTSLTSLSNGAAAEAVLGQPDFTSNTPATTQSGMNDPSAVTVDSAGRLWVLEFGNNRVLRFDNASSVASGAAADGVLGQPDFTSSAAATTQSSLQGPLGAFVSASGTLWVADTNNNRVLRFDNAALKANGAPADGVLGQADFITSTSDTTQTTMFLPLAVFADPGGGLWVADAFNNRVLRFDGAAAKLNGAAADGVLGQLDFTSSTPATTQNGMNSPGGVSGDPFGNLYVADYSNNRILVFLDATLKANGASADGLLGQLDFNSSAPAASAARIDGPHGIFTDPATGALWVSDNHNNRVLGFTGGLIASRVLGQTDFTSYLPATTPSGMYAPVGVAVDPTTGKVFVADYLNHRILRFASTASLANGAPAEAVLGQPDFTSNTPATTQSGMAGPSGVIVDSAGRLWVADTGNHRVLRFDNAALKANGAAADGVLGQLDFTSAVGATTQSGMGLPYGVAVNASGTLWVADTGNHRVLRFDNAALKANGAAADGVLGQLDFTTGTSAVGQNRLYLPTGLYEDSAGRLWVADYGNNRILRFDSAALKANGGNADAVLGQLDFIGNTGFTSQSSMLGPSAVSGDAAGYLFVADKENHRVLIFQDAATLANGANASGVLGQPDFITNVPDVSIAGMNQPTGVFHDPATHAVWVAEYENNRVLMFRACAITVTNTADSGAGSLRQALANLCPGGTITFDSSLSGQTIQLSSTLTINKDVTIDGSALADSIIISGDSDGNGSGDVRVLYINPAVTVNLNALTITKGAVDIGAGIQNYGVLTLTGSTILDNSASSYGGGINNDGTITIANSTFSGNTGQPGLGGGIHNSGVITVLNSTFSGNSNGILNGSAPGTLNLINTILANSTESDCLNYGTLGVESNNLVENPGNCALTDGINNDIVGFDPVLGPLASNGGATQTFALLSGSPALESGDGTTCLSAAVNGRDQRGALRPQGLFCDIGAYEVSDIIPPTAIIDSGPAAYTNSTTAVITFHGSDNFSDPAYLQFQCSLDGGIAASCTSPVTYTSLADGLHSITVYAYDELGNTDFLGTYYQWTVDTLPPDTTLLTYPTNPSSSSSAAFTFSSPEATATFECQLDGGAFTACTSPQSYTGLLSNMHSFAVRARDLAGNVDSSPATYNWLVNTLPERGILEFLGTPLVITTLNVPAQINGYVAPPNSLTELSVQVAGTPVLTETHPLGTVFEENFSAPWTPTQDGVYLLTTQATDSISGTASITSTAFVDTLPAQASLDTATFTSTAYSPSAGIAFTGVTSDTTGVLSATAQLDLGGNFYPLTVHLDENASSAGYLNGYTVYPRTAWSANWWELKYPPDNQAATLNLTVFDTSQTPITYTFPVTLDVIPPAVGTVSLLGDSGGTPAPLATGHTYTGTVLNTSVTIPPLSDGSAISLWVGWTETPTATLSQLAPVASPGISNTITMAFPITAADGGQTHFFHIIAADAFGNTIRRVFGPYYHDLPAMPNRIPTSSEAGGAGAPGDDRSWQLACTLLGVDQRIPGQDLSAAALSAPQSLYLTWDANRLHFAWAGANWNQDGDLFIYLDTVPDQASPYQQVGSQGAYNPYPSTQSSTVLLLPASEWSDNPSFTPPAGAPAVDGMHADYALWVKDASDARLLRYDNPTQQWVEEGSLNALGGSYTLNTGVDGTYTDLVIPFNQVGDPQNWVAPFAGLGPEGMGVVAFAVDAEEGPSGGLRLWSVLPYANPADSARVVSGAPGPDEPHQMMLTDRYVVPIVAGSCFTPEFSPQYFLSAANDGFAFDRFDDSLRLIVPEPSLAPDAFSGLFDPYDDLYQAWLTATYCPQHPTFDGCRPTKAPDPLSDAGLLVGTDEAAGTPLPPGAPVTYTLSYVNPLDTPLVKTAYLYTNNNLNAPESGVTLAPQAWLAGCPGWLELNMEPGAGQLVFPGTVQASGVTTVTLDIEPSYSPGAGCTIVAGDGSAPAYRLNVQHTPDGGAPGFVAIQPDFATVGNEIVSISGTVSDRSAVEDIQIEVTPPHGAVNTFTCTDATPTDDQWTCLWDVYSTVGGPAANGEVFQLRARATDAFGHTSAWSAPQIVTLDIAAPAVAPLPSDPPATITPTLTSDQEVLLSGIVNDNNLIQAVEVCDGTGANCTNAKLTVDPTTVPPGAYSYADTPAAPVAISVSNVCGTGTLGLVRSFTITDTFSVAELQVGLQLSHPYRSDLSALLRGPDGTQINLLSFSKNVLAENINALFTDSSLAWLQDDLSSHDLDAGYAGNSYRSQDSLSAFREKAAAGTWTLTICDRDPANDSGAFQSAGLFFKAVQPLLDVTARWDYTKDVSGSDGQLYSWQVFAVDVRGNRSTVPYDINIQVDNVAPVITTTQTTTNVFVDTSGPGSSAIQVLSGTASDGAAVDSMWVTVTDPIGNLTIGSVEGDASDWAFKLTPTLGGDYRLVTYAADPAANITSQGTFTVSVALPLEINQYVNPALDAQTAPAVQAGAAVTYTLLVANPNTSETAQNVVITSTLSQWLTPLDTNGASLANNLLTWPATTLTGGEILTHTVLARLTDQLVITATLPVTDWVDLHDAIITSDAGLTTDNFGASQANQTSFVVESAQKLLPIDMRMQVAPVFGVVPGSLLTYTLQITNTATITAENLVISDPLSLALTPVNRGGAAYNSTTRTLTWPARNLSPGENLTLIFTARVTSDSGVIAGLNGFIPNQALYSSSLGGGESNLTWARLPISTTVYLPLAMQNVAVSSMSALPGSEVWSSRVKDANLRHRSYPPWTGGRP